MKTKSTLLLGSGIALAFAAAIWAPVQAQSADPSDGVKLTPAQMKDHCRDMREQKVKLTEDAKTQDTKLSAELAGMNAAAEDKKIAQMSAVINLLVEQRIDMNTRRATMEAGMMQHMMQHMQNGKDSMPGCPMMKGADEKSVGDRPESK